MVDPIERGEAKCEDWAIDNVHGDEMTCCCGETCLLEDGETRSQFVLRVLKKRRTKSLVRNGESQMTASSDNCNRVLDELISLLDELHEESQSLAFSHDWKEDGF